MSAFDFNSITSALDDQNNSSGVDFTGKSLKLNTAKDAQPILDAINSCPHLEYLTLTGNTLGIEAAQAIAKALENHPEFKLAKWSDMFTGRMKTEIPPALSALGDGMITAGARLKVLDLSDNAFGPIGVEGLAKLLKSEVCSELQELYLNNNGLGISGAKLLHSAMKQRPPRLRVFVAGRNRLENHGAIMLAELFQKMGTLEEVAMPQNGIYHVGISALSSAFQQNPNLSRLNLNDNTIGPKGAAAIAGALPKLKKLKSINFGDCLLKSKGARALAQGLKDNAVLIESLDVSHNEIGKDACAELVDLITSFSDCSGRLKRVVLAGNSLGNASYKKGLKEKLGAAAELSDGEGSDGEEYVSESENEEESDDDQSEDSAPEDAQHLDTGAEAAPLALDDSGVEEVVTDVERFLREPTPENLRRLGAGPADVIDAHLHSIRDAAALAQAYAAAALSLAALQGEAEQADAMFRALFRRAGERHAAQWLTANALLVALGLLKGEAGAGAGGRARAWDSAACLASVLRALACDACPPALRDTLLFFIQAKRPEALAAQ